MILQCRLCLSSLICFEKSSHRFGASPLVYFAFVASPPQWKIAFRMEKQLAIDTKRQHLFHGKPPKRALPTLQPQIWVNIFGIFLHARVCHHNGLFERCCFQFSGHMLPQQDQRALLAACCCFPCPTVGHISMQNPLEQFSNMTEQRSSAQKFLIKKCIP